MSGSSEALFDLGPSASSCKVLEEVLRVLEASGKEHIEVHGCLLVVVALTVSGMTSL